MAADYWAKTVAIAALTIRRWVLGAKASALRMKSRRQRCQVALSTALALRNRPEAPATFALVADIQAVDAKDSSGSTGDSAVSDLTSGKLTPKTRHTQP